MVSGFVGSGTSDGTAGNIPGDVAGMADKLGGGGAPGVVGGVAGVIGIGAAEGEPRDGKVGRSGSGMLDGELAGTIGTGGVVGTIGVAGSLALAG